MASDDTTSAAPLVPGPSDLTSSSATSGTNEPADQTPSTTLETPRPSEILPVPSVSISAPASAIFDIDTPAAVSTSLQDRLLAIKIMAESIYSVSTDHDGHSDCESIMEAQCFQACTVRIINPGKASLVDLMRHEKPVFKRASQVMIRRPLTRPFISPIQPRHRRATSSDDDDSSNYSQGTPSRNSSTPSLDSLPTTPTFEDNYDALSTSPISDDSSSAPETPKTSLDQDPPLYATYSSSPTPAPMAGLKNRVKLPSRLRLFPGRASTTTIIPDLDGSVEHYHATATTTIDEKSTPRPLIRAASDFTSTPRAYFRKATSPLDRASFAHLIRMPSSASTTAAHDDAPLTARQVAPASTEAALPPTPPARSIWRDAGRSRAFLGHTLRRVESRVGLNAH